MEKWRDAKCSISSGSSDAQVAVRRSLKEKSCGKQLRLTVLPTNKPRASLTSSSWMTHQMTSHQGRSQPPTDCQLSSTMSRLHIHTPAAVSSTAPSSPQAQQAITHLPCCHNQAAGPRAAAAADSCPPPSRVRPAALPSQAAMACASSSTQMQLVTSSSSSSSQRHRVQLIIT